MFQKGDVVLWVNESYPELGLYQDKTVGIVAGMKDESLVRVLFPAAINTRNPDGEYPGEWHCGTHEVRKIEDEV